MITRRELLSIIPALVTPGTDTTEARLQRLEKNQGILASALVEMIPVMQEQARLLTAVIQGCVVLEQRIVTLEEKVFPSLEQGDDMHG